jgi:integrase
MQKSPDSAGQGASTPYVTESHDVLEGMVKVFRTIHSGGVWQMSCWVREEQRYFRKSLRTKILSEAKQLATEEYVGLKARLRNGEMIFARTAKELAAEYLREQERRIRPTGKHQGGITAARFALIKTVLNRHFLGFVGDATKLDKIDPLRFRDYFKERWKAQPSIKTITLKNERSVISGMYKYALEHRRVTQAQLPVFDKLPSSTQRYSAKDNARDAFTVEEWKAVYDVVESWAKGVNDPVEKDRRQFVRDFILISANTGLRFGEMRKLKWSMVDVYQEGSQVNVKISVPPDTKTGARPVQGRMGGLLERIRRYSKFTGRGDWVFVDNETGEQLERKVYYRLWDELLLRAGLKDTTKRLTFYSLRHTYCTMRLMAGVDVFLLARNMGTSVKYIEEHYGHVDIDKMRHELTRDRRGKADDPLRVFRDS